MSIFVDDKFWKQLPTFSCVYDRADKWNRFKNVWSIGYTGTCSTDNPYGYNHVYIVDDGGGVSMDTRIPNIRKLETVVVQRDRESEYGRYIEFDFKYGTNIKIYQNSRVEMKQGANELVFENSPYYIDAIGDRGVLTKDHEGRATELYIRNAFGDEFLPLQDMDKDEIELMLEELVLWKLSR